MATEESHHRKVDALIEPRAHVGMRPYNAQDDTACHFLAMIFSWTDLGAGSYLSKNME